MGEGISVVLLIGYPQAAGAVVVVGVDVVT